MATREQPYRYARLIAWLSWLIVGGPTLLGELLHPREIATANQWLWMVAFVAFGPTIYVPADGYRSRGTELVRLGVATLSPLLMVYAEPRSFACTLLVIVAWEVALVLPMRAVLPWILGQSIATTVLLSRALPLEFALPEVAIYLGFQGYAVITAHVARSEAATRRMLAGANAELRTTQSLLGQSIRAGERLRLSRELHDLIGHHLAAMVLNLEVARHTGSSWLPHVVKSQELARQLLADVRNVVKLLRTEERVELRSTLEQMITAIPQIQIHVNVSEYIEPLDGELTHVLIRLTQEAITNAIKHSGCRNLWINIERCADRVEVRVRDDGHGAQHLSLGSGLTGMLERVEELGGSLAVSPPGKCGFQITAQVPVGQNAA